ncbi:MAG TPA: hypothetical protein VN842_00765 [Thermoplasmata archaeon]|nr:hypothetical protein [Thermoplasmata archaeon]
MRSIWILAVAVLAVVATSLAPVVAAVVPSEGSSAPARAAASVAPAVAGPAASPAGPQCPTPQNFGDWTSSNFFDDVLVSFAVPGHTNLSGGNFQTVPCLNSLPTYLPGFWMNVSTNVPLLQAYVNVWGTLWPTPNQPLADLPGFPYDSTQVTQLPMYVAPGTPDQASFYFNTHRFFYPGSTVYFNVTLKSTVGTPGTIDSANSLSQLVPSGSNLNATWKFSLDAPWWSPHFSDDLRLSTDPPVLGAAVYDPNENQSLSVGIQSVGANGFSGAPIPDALLTFSISNDPGFDGTYSIPFGAQNHTFQNLSSPIGPYPGATIELNVSAWLPWEGGAIDKIVSGGFWFNWSKGGGWPAPELGLAANAVIAANPSVLTSGTPVLAGGTPVNLSLTETTPNVTISSSIVRFHFADTDGSVAGIVPMHPIGQNVSYVVLPGFPSGGRLTFSVLAKDVFGNPLASGNYSYAESGGPTSGPTAFSSYFYVEGINATTGLLLTGAAFTVSNATWSQSAVTGPFGLGLLVIPNGAGTLELPYGSYTVTMTALGHTQTAEVTLGSSTPVTVRFWFANGPISATSEIPLSPLSIGLIAGVVAVTVALYPLFRWFQERQKKAEQERTRVTL